MRRWAAPAILAALVLLVSACGEKPEPSGSATPGPRERLTVVLDYFPNADHAALYAAQAAGLYDKAGLDVKLVAPPDPSAPLKLLRARRADLAISYEPELLLARDAGAEDLVSVGALVQRPLTSIISLPAARIAHPADLAGRTIGTAGIPYQAAYLKTILHGAPARQVDVGFNLVPALLAGKVDATLGAFWNYEGVDLARRGKHPRILRIDEAGVPTYAELIFVARAPALDPDGASRVRRFLQATAGGVQLLRRDPAIGVDALLRADKGLDRELQAAAVRATLPVFMPADRSRPFGWQDPAAWARYELWMRRNGLLKRQLSAAPLTNEFLPGEALADSG